MDIQCKKCKKTYKIDFKFNGVFICPDCSAPSLAQKAQNFAVSAINHISNGMIKVSDLVKEERMAICRTCSFFNPNNTCNKCGCFLDVKTGWASEKCPEGKWLEVKTQSSGGCGCSKKT